MEDVVEEIVDDPVIRSSWLENKIDANEIPETGTTTTIVKIRRVTSRQFVTDRNPNGERYIIVTPFGDAYLNWTSFKSLRNAFGLNTKDWRGKSVNVFKRVQMVRGVEKQVLYFEPA